MHTLRDFKGFEAVDVDLSRPLTVVLGPNGVGKSNLIEGIELLAFLASGQGLHEVTDLGHGGRFELRGGLHSCARTPLTEFTLGVDDVTVSFAGADSAVDYRITLSTHERPVVLREALTVAGREWFRALVDHLSPSHVFDLDVTGMRGYERIGSTVLLRDGSNLSSVLHGLSIGSDLDKAALGRVEGYVLQIPEERFGALRFTTTALHDVVLGLTRETDGELIDARILSDGTLRALAQGSLRCATYPASTRCWRAGRSAIWPPAA